MTTTRPTGEQLQRLTDIINARFEEFAVGRTPVFEPHTLGQVRLILGAVEEWQGEQACAPLDDIKLPASAAQRSQNMILDDDSQHGDDPTGLDGEPDKHDQLDRRKARHTASGTQGVTAFRPGRVSLAPNEEARAAHRAVPTREEVIAEVQHIAMGGTMPTMKQFDDAKPATWASAAAHLLRLNTSWPQLAEEAGLKPREPGQRAASKDDAP
jgi:hypothetical protein